MYAWLWHHLPGPLPVRLVIVVLVLAAVLVLLFLVVFPWVQERLPYDDGVVRDAPNAAGVQP